MTSTALTPEQIVARNMAAVDAHFHNENPQDIDKAIDLYADSIVWELPARGLLLRDKAAVKAAYLKLFESVKFHSITPIRRFAAATGSSTTAWERRPSSGTSRPTSRAAHCRAEPGQPADRPIFELDDDGRIIRENGNELWRRADGPIDDASRRRPDDHLRLNARIVAPHPCHMRARTGGEADGVTQLSTAGSEDGLQPGHAQVDPA